MHAGRLVVAGLLVAGSAGAEVYRWTDPDGTEHFTDNPSSVPANVKARATRGADISTVSVVDARPVARVAPADGPAVAPARAEPVDARRSEREWRAAFRDVAERQARLEDEIEVDRRKVEDVNGLPVAARFHCAAMGGGVLFVP
ncbi:MAG: DUF4124 domain-containing protein, partial [Myxococcaceae bacterium]|nr:DUF4124 domain-containing protein [Myxococcaceae bacterium]